MVKLTNRSMSSLWGSALALLSIFALSACGEPETLPDKAPLPNDTPALDRQAESHSPASNVPGNTKAASGDLSEREGKLAESATPGNSGTPGTPGTSSPVSEADDDRIVLNAAPGIDVNCNRRLPCRAQIGGDALNITLTAADGERLDGQGALRVDVVIEARSRDTQVALGQRSRIVTGGQVLAMQAGQLGLSSMRGEKREAYPLIAGVPINGHITFGGNLIGNAGVLDRVVLELSESRTTLTVNWLNVPLGPEANPPVDCQNILPCQWSPNSGLATLTLNDAAEGRWNRATRLLVSWTLQAQEPMELVVTDLGRVFDGAGQTLEPYGVELDGVESRGSPGVASSDGVGAGQDVGSGGNANDDADDGALLAHLLDANEQVSGLLVPRRAPSSESGFLSRVEIGVSERRAPRAPRWQPVFLNVPLRGPG